jgi:hypothetical protein
MQRITSDAVQWAAWQPGSEGFFYLAGKRLYLAAFPNLAPFVVDEVVQPGKQLFLGWMDTASH